MQVGVNYYPSDWRYNTGAGYTDTLLNNDFAFFASHNITYIEMMVMWRYLEPTMGNYDQNIINNYIRVLDAAQANGVKVGIIFWTQPPHDGAGDSYYPSWVGNFTNIHSNTTIRQAWLNMVAEICSQLASHPAVEYWHICNEPYTTSGAMRVSCENWMVMTAQKIREYSVKDRSCHFILGWNPYSYNHAGYWPGTGAYGRIMDELEAVGLTIYNDPLNEGYETFSRGSWQDLTQAKTNATAAGKDCWVVEFGDRFSASSGPWTSAQDELQRVHFERCFNLRFTPTNISRCIAWTWRSISPNGESFNICRGSVSPRPAFYELEEAVLPGGTYVKSFTSNAMLQQVQTKSFTSDAMLLAQQVKSFTSDAVLEASAPLCTWGTPTTERWVAFHNLGDVNDDGVINILDAVALVNHWYTPIYLDNGYDENYDLNGDGWVDAEDAARITANIGRNICDSCPVLFTSNALLQSSGQISFTSDAVLAVGETGGGEISFTSDAILTSTSLPTMPYFAEILSQLKKTSTPTKITVDGTPQMVVDGPPIRVDVFYDGFERLKKGLKK